ncbi:MAG: fibronectin type III domain-containing protein, partial [Acidimicrobiales bacterium]
MTPYIGTTAQTPTVISGSPPATTATIARLTNGTAYTFTVSATNAVGTGSASSPSNSVTPTAPTPPGAPTGVSASAGNGSASVNWTAPPNGGSPITSYTVTPYIGTTAQTPTVISGSPPATTATIAGLTNGTAYTFTVSATNAVGTGSASSPSNSVTPTATTPPSFVQSATAHGSNKSSLAVAPSSNITTGNRLVVEAATWNGSGATTSSVTDSAGNTYVELTHFTASDGTEMSIWSAPITKGGGTKPTITVRPTSSADVGLTSLEYSGLSSVADASVVDQKANATGMTTSARSISSGATGATTANNELAIGFYADSGFGDTLTPDPGYTSRA